MLNIVEKYAAEAPEAAEDGVVAIEYVLVAAAVFVGVGVVFAAGLWDDLFKKLDGLAK